MTNPARPLFERRAVASTMSSSIGVRVTLPGPGQPPQGCESTLLQQSRQEPGADRSRRGLDANDSTRRTPAHRPHPRDQLRDHDGVRARDRAVRGPQVPHVLVMTHARDGERHGFQSDDREGEAKLPDLPAVTVRPIDVASSPHATAIPVFRDLRKIIHSTLGSGSGSTVTQVTGCGRSPMFSSRPRGVRDTSWALFPLSFASGRFGGFMTGIAAESGEGEHAGTRTLIPTRNCPAGGAGTVAGVSPQNPHVSRRRSRTGSSAELSTGSQRP